MKGYAMAKEISSFDLEILAKKHNIRLWFCEKIGRRWSFIVGAGEQRPLPSELIYSDKNHGMFVQGEDYDQIELEKDVKNLFEKSGNLIA
jgi:hypothetical protein